MNPSNENKVPNRKELIRISKSGASDHKWKDDPFVSDAIEGFQLSSAPLNSLKRLDKRFVSQNWLFVSSGLIVLILLGIFIYGYQKPHSNKQQSVSVATHVGAKTGHHKQAMKIEEKIYPKRESIKNGRTYLQKILKDEFEKASETGTVKQIDPIDLPIQPVEKMDEHIIPIKLNKTGKELYLYELKTVDYRAYRAAPKTGIPKLFLTGTPASENTEIFGSMETDSIPYINFITLSMKDVKKGNYMKAKIQLEQILKSYPSDINALFYSGICSYELGDYKMALDYFTRAEKGEFDNFEEEAEWYRLKCFQQIGDHLNTEILIKKIRERQGFYSKQLN